MQCGRLRALGLAIAAAVLLGTTAAPAASYRVVYTFLGNPDGSVPVAGLTNVGGTLYGTTLYGGLGAGTVFKVSPSTGAASVVYAFRGGGDGSSPRASLINVAGTLYGTTYEGGASGQGTVFRVNPKTGAESVVYSFTGGSDGGNPRASLINVAGTLYGTTEFGGLLQQCGLGCFSYSGTVFKLTPGTGAQNVVYAFNGPANPYASLTNVGGKLFGTTVGGGAVGRGSVFKVDPASGAHTVVYSFTGGGDGSSPRASLINVGGTLYGTAYCGGDGGGGCPDGAVGYGTVFKINSKTGAQSTLHAFQNVGQGTRPTARLLNINGVLYGTTSEGGAFNSGTIFSVNPSTGAFTLVHSFDGGAGGAAPSAGLINVGGTLYGTAASGGTSGVSCPGGCGVVFAFTP